MSTDLNRMLRHPHDPGLRLQAVRALGEMDDFEAVPLLIRAVVEDPDAQVRTAAREALLYLIGAETDLAVKTYRAQPDDDDWLVDEGDSEEDPDGGPSFEDDQYLTGLISVLRNHPDASMRLKAVDQLAENSDLRVIAALSETVLWSDDPRVRQAALQSLQQRFGEDTDEIIQSYQVLDGGDQEEEGESDEWESEQDDAEQSEEQAEEILGERWHTPLSSPITASQEVKYEGFPWLLIGAAALGLLVVALIILFSL